MTDVVFNPFTSKLQFLQPTLTGDMVLQGDWDASGAYPSPVQSGWYWIVTVGAVKDSVDYNVGDGLVAKNTNTSPTSSDFFKVDNTEDESVSTTQSLAVGDALPVTHKTMRVQSAGGAIVSSAVPPIDAGSYDNQPLFIQGMSDTDTWELPAAIGVKLNGGVNFKFNKNNTMFLRWSSAESAWIEQSRSANAS